MHRTIIPLLFGLTASATVSTASAQSREIDPIAEPAPAGLVCSVQKPAPPGEVVLNFQVPDSVMGPRLLTVNFSTDGNPLFLNVVAPETPPGTIPARAQYLSATLSPTATGRITTLISTDTTSIAAMLHDAAGRFRALTPEELTRARSLAVALWKVACHRAAS